MQFNRIVMHHTGGAYKANSIDLLAYHTVTNGDGTTVRGVHPYSANARGTKLEKGKYAAHTLNLNSGSIGKAVACMAGGDWAYPQDCDYFPRASQMDMFLLDVAKDAKYYGIPVTRKNVLSHAEVEITLRVDQRNKWDFDYDPYGLMSTRDPIAIGDMLREKIHRFMVSNESIRTVPAPSQEMPDYPTIRQGNVGVVAAELQTLLRAHGYNINVDSQFGPATRQAVINFQRKRQLVPDGVVGQMTWAALHAG